VGGIANITRTTHEVVKRRMQEIIDEGFINRGGRHEVIAGELTQQGSTFQVNATEWVLSVLVEPSADELESVH
jgi:hypothetical protein